MAVSKVLPEKHKGPLLDQTKDKLFQGKITENFNYTSAINIEGKSGTAIFLNCMAPHASNLNQSPYHRRTPIVSYRAAGAFPIYIKNLKDIPEKYARLVKGYEVSVARFTMDEFPIPKYKDNIISFYQLQEHSKNKTLQLKIQIQLLRNIKPQKFTNV